MEVMATYEHGVAKPIQPLELPEGTLVKISFEVAPPATPSASEAAKLLAEIAAMPSSNKEVIHESDIDKIIYGGEF